MSDTLSGSTAAGSTGPGEPVAQVAGTVMPSVSAPLVVRRRGEFLYYAVHNRKLVFGLALEVVFVLAAIFGPFISPWNTTEYFLPRQPPSGVHWDDKISSALHAVALNPGDVLGKYPHQLSGGQQQRLLIARALLLDVKLLVADDIISMLDASTRVDILNLLISLKRSGLAILFITHDLSLGNYVSDRTVILRRGAIVEMGDTVKVFSNPQHPYTRDLLAAVAELHKKWHPAAGQTQAFPANGAAGSRGNGAGDVLTRAEGPQKSAPTLEPPPLTLFEEDHFVAAAES